MCAGDLFEPDETCTIYETEEKTAARDHDKPCAVCAAPIKKGEIYTRHAHLFDGKWSGGKLCVECTKVWRTFREEHDGYVYPPTDLIENIDACIDNSDTDARDRVIWEDTRKQILQRARGNRVER